MVSRPTGLIPLAFSHCMNHAASLTTRGHTLKVTKRSSRTQLRQNFFSNRVVNLWKKWSWHKQSIVSKDDLTNTMQTKDSVWNGDTRQIQVFQETAMPCRYLFQFRQHVKIGQQASCLLYRMMMMIMMMMMMSPMLFK